MFRVSVDLGVDTCSLFEGSHWSKELMHSCRHYIDLCFWFGMLTEDGYLVYVRQSTYVRTVRDENVVHE